MTITAFARSARLRHTLLWTAILWGVVFWRLGFPGLIDPDEPHYAQLTREMLRSRSWLVPLLNGAPFLDKPVLFHWLQMASIQLFGETELALRIPAALAAVALIGVVRWVALELFGRGAGALAPMMFATVPLTFALARVAVFDMVFTLFLFGAVACLLVAGLRDRPRLQYAGWLLLVLAVMTKGPVAGALVVLFGAALAMRRSTRPIVTRLRWAAGPVFVAVAAAPWFGWLWIVYGDDFLQHYVLAGNLYYFTSPPSYSTRNSGSMFYLRVFAGAFFPWSLVAIARGVDALRLWRQKRALAIEEQALWTWIAVVVGFFTVARFKLDYYIFPTAPAACLLAAYAVVQAGRPATADPPRIPAAGSAVPWAFAATGIVLALAGVVGSVALFQINLGLTRPALVLPLALATGGGVLIACARRRWPLTWSVAATAATLLLAYGAVVLFGLPILERSRPTPPLGRWIAEHAPADVPVGVYRVSDWLSTARYYSERPVVRLDTEEAVREFIERWPDAFVILPLGHCERLGAAGFDLQPLVGLPGIVGRTGKYLRSQVWDRIVVAARAAAAKRIIMTDTDPELLAGLKR